ncbi:hypothetical protein [Stenotrophomonas maltophilia]|uniref:hypothetical protein n=1 Tax=Stenotrophomonas maltophilia TaxID=40324 RepID=UPI00066CE7BD|nr:hypothetical protein [Stenotrophomonas maltophilia]MDH0794607.1 hypothetical protein [Stenotrophomonas maltophilia]
MHIVLTESQTRQRRIIIPLVAYTAVAAIGIAGPLIWFKLSEQGSAIAATATSVFSIFSAIVLFLIASIARINHTLASNDDVQHVLEMLESGVPNLETIASAMRNGNRLANRDVEFARRMASKWKRGKEREAQSNATSALCVKQVDTASRYLDERHQPH